MKVAVCIVLILLVLTAESDGWSRRRRRRRSSRTRVNVGIKNGVDVNRGRHNVNVNYKRTRYNYKGRNVNLNADYNYWKKKAGVGVQTRRWNVRANHSFKNRHTSIGANRGNHGLSANYNHRNRAVGVGYKWKFGKRRRRELGTSHRDVQTAKMRLSELSEDLEILKTLVPIIGQVSLPPEEQPITDEILARDMVCLVRQFGQLLPQMKVFIKKMVRKHGPEYGLQVELEDENIPECPVFGESAGVQGDYRLERQQLVELKNFVSELIFTELHLRAEFDE